MVLFETRGGGGGTMFYKYLYFPFLVDYNAKKNIFAQKSPKLGDIWK